MEWILFASLSAVFAGLTSILAKMGIKDIDSTVVTALRTIGGTGHPPRKGMHTQRRRYRLCCIVSGRA